VMELKVERATVVNYDGATGPIIQKMAVETTISAKDGQTIVLGGLMQGNKEGGRELIIAVTPRVNPMR